MSRYYKQMHRGGDEARRLLNERLVREEMGDSAYEKMVVKGEDGTFRIVGVVLMFVFAGIVLAVTALGL